MTRAARRLAALVGAAIVLGAASADAHVGSWAAVQDGQAGPYRVLVTVRPPDVVPGIATIDVRTFDDDIMNVSVVPLPLEAAGDGPSPIPDRARRSPADAHLFASKLWLMQTRAWQIRVTVDGARGAGVFAVPIPALPRAVRLMPPGLTVMLLGLLILLVTGAVSIAGAGAREADLPAGAIADPSRRRRGRVGMIVAAALIVGGVVLGKRWWNHEATFHRRQLYKPLRLDAALTSPDELALTLADPGWLRWRQTDDLLPDHGHVMHLFVVRTPGLDAIAHVHPVSEGGGRFAQAVPPLPPGRYRLFGDVVHETGLDETAIGALDWAGAPAAAAATPLDAGRFDADDAVALVAAAANAAAPSFALADGAGRVRWIDPRPIAAGDTVALEFEAETLDGKPAPGVEPYMGMAGHAMIVARDLSVFAHIHPTGSVPMAALALVGGGAASMPMPMHHHHMAFAPRVRFPYVFPRAGGYRVFVQMKRQARIETAAFDVSVDPGR